MVFRLHVQDARSIGGPSEAGRLLDLARHDDVTRSAAHLLLGMAAGLVALNICLAAADRHFAVAAQLWAILDMSSEGSLSERYLQGICILAATLFAFDAGARRSRLSAFLALLYAVVWLDDTALYHETAGGGIAAAFGLQPALGLRPQDFGEIIAWTAIALPLTVAAAWAWRDRKPGDAGLGVLAGVCFAALVFFAVAVDMLHAMASGKLHTLFGIVEDGGETFAISATAILALANIRFGERYRAECAR